MVKRAQVVPWVPSRASVVRIHTYPTMILKEYKDGKSILNGDFNSVINSVDLVDLLDFIKSLSVDKWVPNAYWKHKNNSNKFHWGEAVWAVYSYLIDRKILIIEDQYYGWNSSRTNKYLLKNSYDSTFENSLYDPILKKMVDSKYLNQMDGKYFQINKSILRSEKLEILDI